MELITSVYFKELSLYSQRTRWSQTITYHIQKTGIFCISETWINRFEPKFIDYVSKWQNRGELSIGLVIILQKNLWHDKFHFILFHSGKFKVQAVKIVLKNNDCLITMNMYRVSCPMINPLSAMVWPLENFWFIQIWQIVY